MLLNPLPFRANIFTAPVYSNKCRVKPHPSPALNTLTFSIIKKTKKKKTKKKKKKKKKKRDNEIKIKIIKVDNLTNRKLKK
jgi:hypothetical protein